MKNSTEQTVRWIFHVEKLDYMIFYVGLSDYGPAPTITN